MPIRRDSHGRFTGSGGRARRSTVRAGRTVRKRGARDFVIGFKSNSAGKRVIGRRSIKQRHRTGRVTNHFNAPSRKKLLGKALRQRKALGR